MTSVGKVVTTSYLYDVNDERIALGANGATTTYPFKLYNVQGNTIYKHIFANGEPVADVQGSTTTAKVYYIHDDHLGGSSVISDANANVAQVLEYYPFGGTRLDQRPDNTFNEQRRSDGHEFDTGTGLLYEDARYLGPTLSRFLSEDPSFLAIGDSSFSQMAPASSFTQPDVLPGLEGLLPSAAPDANPSSRSLTLALADPQSLNSYSYVENNPEIYRDPDGKNAEIVYIYAGGTHEFGAHAFILITPNSGQTSLQIPGYIGQQQLTISGEPTGNHGTGALVLQIDNSDNSISPSQYLERDPIFAPVGITQQEYDQGLVRLAKTKIANGGILDQRYFGLGTPQVSGGSNSNNAATSLINQSVDSSCRKASLVGNMHGLRALARP
jgi:RHS repeat-associated protein